MKEKYSVDHFRFWGKIAIIMVPNTNIVITLGQTDRDAETRYFFGFWLFRSVLH